MLYEELVTFVTLAEVKNFTKTAEKLLMSQPTVSLHIKNLEREFQTTLFYRNPKLLKITPSGELLLERAKHMLSLYENTKKDILEYHKKMSGSLKIGASFTIGECMLPNLLKKISQQYPDLQLEVSIGSSDEIIRKVKIMQLDIGLIEEQKKEKDLVIVPFLKDELVVFARHGHPLAAKQPLSIVDLQHENWVMREEGTEQRKYIHDIFQSNQLQVASTITISNNQGIKEAVIAGLGISLLSKWMIERELKHKYVSLLHLQDTPFTRSFSYVCSPLLEEKQNVQLFIRLMHQLDRN